MIRYVLGFAFHKNKVAMIYKTKGPKDIQNKWNGIGGKIEQNETPIDAMVREFYEETTLLIPKTSWVHYGIMKSNYFEADLFWSFSELDHLPFIENKEGDLEIVQWFDIDNIIQNNYPIVYPTVQNVKMLIMLALNEPYTFTELYRNEW